MYLLKKVNDLNIYRENSVDRRKVLTEDTSQYRK